MAEWISGMLRHSPIDHVLLSKDLADRIEVTDAWEGTTPDGAKLSDHSGLVVEVCRGVLSDGQARGRSFR
jgi:endonuclease/exonuclease/phosphatase family metal-dependent hydrolase